jgi:purine-binding chemotaxis protein CheW
MRGIERARPKQSIEIVQMVAFSVGAGDYALDIMRIKEIINAAPITAIPKAPAFVEGVIELRGAILPIVDLRKRFDLPASPLTRVSKYLITVIDVNGKRMIVGLIVDQVHEPIRVQREQIRPAPALAQGEQIYFVGVVHHNDRILMVLDIDAILSSREKVTLAGMGAK